MKKEKTAKAKIGLIGLAVMGANLARNIANKKIPIIVFNRTTEKTENFIKKSGNKFLTGEKNLKNFIEKLELPRKIILLIQAGEAVDTVIKQLTPLLQKNDILIDCGNSHFKDTERRQKELDKKHIHFIGCGISGGEKGALNGPSIMPGGNFKAWQKIKPILEKIAAIPAEQAGIFSKPCVAYIGPSGAGHFVKIVHNGIEYGIMQLIAETYDIFKTLTKFSNQKISKIFRSWNKNKNLFLLEITAKILSRKDNLIDFIKDSAGQKGTGKWTVEEAQNIGVAMPTISSAVDARILSGNLTLRAANRSLQTKKSAQKIPENFTQIIKDALFSSIFYTYLQGFELLKKAGKEYKWNLNLNEIARVWQGGCIIRSNYLKNFQKLKPPSTFEQKNWRLTVSIATNQAIPIPAISATLAYHDSIQKKHLPQNLIQAQRDFFGSHTYERIDKKGIFHTEWK